MPAGYRPAVLLDSGAYTNFKMGKKAAETGAKFTPMTVEGYCEFLERNHDKFFAYFNMDAINHADKEASARDSRENYLIMRKRGLHPIPVFHQGEDIRWLHQMLDDGAEYIALAVASTLHSREKEKGWYDCIWNSLVNAGGLPTLRVHALGDTREFSLQAYPWYSCDSSSWAQNTGKGGRVKVLANGKSLNISMRKDGLSDRSNRDLESFSGEELEALLSVFAEYGIDYRRMTERRPEDHIFRLFLGMVYFKQLQDQMFALPPRRIKRAGLFETGECREGPTIEVDGPRIFLASWLSPEFTTVFKLGQYPYLLLSYAWIGGLPNYHRMKHAEELFWRFEL
jgi:hypothetical protein